MPKNNLNKWLPDLHYQVWILAGGRLLSQIGTGFTLFYAPIFFVNQVGLSPTLVGIGLGSASVSGVIGRFLGGSFSDSKFWGRKRTLLLSAAISALADVVLALTYGFPLLVVGNLLMGLGQGLYWPATEAAVADLSTAEQRNEAFAVTRLADSLGLGVGVVLGGALISTAGNYRLLFVIDGISFVLFFGVIYWAISETYRHQEDQHKPAQAWLVALKDRYLMIFVVVNIFFTTYIALVQSILPLYFKNFVSPGFSAAVISGLFTWHIAFAALCQLPVARFLNRLSRPRALSLSLLLWGVGFVLVWATGVVAALPVVWATVALGIFAVGMVAYNPSASGLVVDLAPETLRGVYFSINSQCWAAGFFLGPTLGGWALDHSDSVANRFWLVTALSAGVGILILQYFERVWQRDRHH